MGKPDGKDCHRQGHSRSGTQKDVFDGVEQSDDAKEGEEEHPAGSGGRRSQCPEQHSADAEGGTNDAEEEMAVHVCILCLLPEGEIASGFEESIGCEGDLSLLTIPIC